MTRSTTLNVTTPTDREIVVTRTFNAPRELVFKALTTPALLTRWMNGPNEWSLAVCEIDLRVGGAFRYVWRNAAGKDMGMGGVWKEIAAPERLVHEEEFDQDWTGGRTTVTTVLSEDAGKTTLTLTVLYSSKESRDGALGTGMVDGMAAGYDQLAELLPTLARD